MAYKCVCFDNHESKYNNENINLKAPLDPVLPFPAETIRQDAEKESKEIND